jgi:arylsulfatase
LEGSRAGGPASTVFLGMNWATLGNTPFRRYKHFTHEGGISSPFIAHWPAGIARSRAGQWERQPGHLIDVLPTVADAAKAKFPTEIRGAATLAPEGVSLLPALAGKPLGRKQPLFFMHEGNRAVRDGKWKLVSKYMDPWELFDMQEDRTELRNLAAQHPEIVARLSGAYDAWAKRTFAEQWTGPRRTDWGAEILDRDPAKKGRKKQ